MTEAGSGQTNIQIDGQTNEREVHLYMTTLKWYTFKRKTN